MFGMRNKSYLLFILFPLLPLSAYCQEVTIKGKVLHPEDPTFNLLIVNQTTSRGTFGDGDGTFEIKADKSDTIMIGAIGYQTQKISMSDSAIQEEYFVKVSVSRLAYELKTVTIMPQRELDSIQKDIRNLGYDDRDYMLSGIDAIHSPLTFLYQQVSRQERMKRNAYQVINEDRRRDLLKELFVRYVSYDIIDLRTDQFEDFIDFMNVSEGQMKSMTQYEFVVFTKSRYQQFKNTPERLRQDIDFHD
jgi:hypothetical protein